MNKIYLVLISIWIAFSVQSQNTFQVLLVNDNGNGTDRYLELDTALTQIGVSYSIYNTVETGDYPDLSILAPNDVVIWYTGNDGVNLKLWDLSNPDDYKFNPPLMDYVDNGGIVWLQGLDFLYDVYDSIPVYFTPGQFIYDYMGISTYYAQSYADDGNQGLPEMDVVPGNGICSISPVQWTYSTLWYADALELNPLAQGIYKMGPQGYIFDNYFTGVYNEFGDSKIFSLAVETARIDTEAHTDTLFAQTLSYFESISGGEIMVTDVNVSSEGGATSIDVNGGSLQMMAEVLPENATNPSVFWSIVGGTALASIDQTGLLQASGTTVGNGTAWVKAAAVDGSGIADSMLITISNQGADFEVLLVNDNDFGADRYLELDTALTNLAYAHDVYNTALTNEAPDFSLLSNYDLVIWYTGNDGVDLFLWDTSDTTNYKFNLSLMLYLENGGKVWVQGLDYFFDIYSGTPVYFSEGQFIYDQMGISSYYAQSYVDDGNTGVPQLDVVEGNPVCSFTPILWTYPTMWYVDALEISADAHGIYTLGPDGYIFDSYYAGVLKLSGISQILSFTFETARIDSQSNTDALFYDVIEYFRLFTGISKTGANSAQNIQVFPNPVTDKLQVKFENRTPGPTGIRLVDMFGKTVYQSRKELSLGIQSFDINLTSLQLPTGVYTCNIITNSGIQSKKVVINK